jgi:hypothetical protein
MRPWQFSIANLFECVTCCAIVSAFAAVIGPVSMSLLIAMTLAIGAGRGLLALLAFAAAMLAADSILPTPAATQPAGPYGVSTILVTLLAAALAGWYAFRRKVRSAVHRPSGGAATI